MSAEFQVQFLRQLKCLLDEGDFSATYKFALLRALADLSVERIEYADHGLTISVRDIAERFIEYYWRQARPYRDSLLSQSNKGQAEVITKIARHQSVRAYSLSEVQADAIGWDQLVRQVATNVEKDPLRRLQKLPSGISDFLYAQPPERGNARPSDVTIHLRPGVPQAFAEFHPLIISLIEAAWVRRLVSISTNSNVLGDAGDLSQFLFGSDRQALDGYRHVLVEFHGSQCFYCPKPLVDGGHVDHFIPWARYPTDLGHNFVLACARCNGQKSDHLAGIGFLKRWREMNLEAGKDLADAFRRRNLPHNLERSRGVAQWAYAQGERARTHAWAGMVEFVPLGADWREALGVAAPLQHVAEESGPYGVAYGDARPVTIRHPVILIRVDQLYQHGMSALALYEITRGIWLLSPDRAAGAKFAFAVFEGVVREVYEIRKWHPAGSTKYKTRSGLRIKGRWEFTGKVATDAIRRHYVDHAVTSYFPRGSRAPFRYVGC